MQEVSQCMESAFYTCCMNLQYEIIVGECLHIVFLGKSLCFLPAGFVSFDGRTKSGEELEALFLFGLQNRNSLRQNSRRER